MREWPSNRLREELPRVMPSGDLRERVFALVSTLDGEDLIECARAFLREGGRKEATAKGEPPGISSLHSSDHPPGRAESGASSPMPKV